MSSIGGGIVHREPYAQDTTTQVIAGPEPIPTSPTPVLTGDCWLRELDISNPTSGAITVTVTDMDGNSFIPSLVLPGPGGMVSYIGCRYMPDGIIWGASAPGLMGYIRTNI